jgi:hypothetical protein
VRNFDIVNYNQSLYTFKFKAWYKKGMAQKGIIAATRSPLPSQRKIPSKFFFFLGVSAPEEHFIDTQFCNEVLCRLLP